MTISLKTCNEGNNVKVTSFNLICIKCLLNTAIHKQILPVCFTISDQTANIARHFSSLTVNMILINTSGNLTKHFIVLGYLLHFEQPVQSACPCSPCSSANDPRLKTTYIFGASLFFLLPTESCHVCAKICRTQAKKVGEC